MVWSLFSVRQSELDWSGRAGGGLYSRCWPRTGRDQQVDTGHLPVTQHWHSAQHSSSWGLPFDKNIQPIFSLYFVLSSFRSEVLFLVHKVSLLEIWCHQSQLICRGDRERERGPVQKVESDTLWEWVVWIMEMEVVKLLWWLNFG